MKRKNNINVFNSFHLYEYYIDFLWKNLSTSFYGQISSIGIHIESHHNYQLLNEY